MKCPLMMKKQVRKGGYIYHVYTPRLHHHCSSVLFIPWLSWEHQEGNLPGLPTGLLQGKIAFSPKGSGPSCLAPAGPQRIGAGEHMGSFAAPLNATGHLSWILGSNLVSFAFKAGGEVKNFLFLSNVLRAVMTMTQN